MSIYEYNEELHIKNEREIAFQQGIEQGLERGIEQGLEQGIQVMVLDYMEDGKTRDEILAKLQKRFQLTETETEQYYSRYAE